MNVPDGPGLEMTSLEDQLRASVAIIQARKAAARVNALNENLHDCVLDLHAESERLRTQVMAVQCINDTLKRELEFVRTQLEEFRRRERRHLAIVAGTEFRNGLTHVPQI